MQNPRQHAVLVKPLENAIAPFRNIGVLDGQPGLLVKAVARIARGDLDRMLGRPNKIGKTRDKSPSSWARKLVFTRWTLVSVVVAQPSAVTFVVSTQPPTRSIHPLVATSPCTPTPPFSIASQFATKSFWMYELAGIVADDATSAPHRDSPAAQANLSFMSEPHFFIEPHLSIDLQNITCQQTLSRIDLSSMKAISPT